MTAPEPDARVLLPCIDCRREFLALGAWQSRCHACYKTWKSSDTPRVVAELLREIAGLHEQLEEARAEAERWRQRAQSKAAATGHGQIPAQHWRRLLQLAHPDKHGNSEAANVVTKWLLS